MASTYTRPRSPFIHIRFKDDRGKWQGRPTSYRIGNPGDVRQAELMARRLTEQDRVKRPTGGPEQWSRWVERWLHERYAGRENETHDIYMRWWRRLFAWLAAQKIHSPRQFAYRHALEYREHRLAEGASNNSVIQELKFMGNVMGEAVKRCFCDANPCVRMGFRKSKPAEKIPWKDGEIGAAVELATELNSAFIMATLILGIYQAARMGQCAVALRDLDLEGGRITYRKTKGDKPFTQPIDPRAIPHLRRIAESRLRGGFDTLCEIPPFASIMWRVFLDILGFKHLVHHGLRVTWITRAALSRGAVSLSEAKRFVNHGSTAVHEAYQKLSAEDLIHVPSAMNLPSLP